MDVALGPGALVHRRKRVNDIERGTEGIEAKHPLVLTVEDRQLAIDEVDLVAAIVQPRCQHDTGCNSVLIPLEANDPTALRIQARHVARLKREDRAVEKREAVEGAKGHADVAMRIDGEQTLPGRDQMRAARD